MAAHPDCPDTSDSAATQPKSVEWSSNDHFCEAHRRRQRMVVSSHRIHPGEQFRWQLLFLLPWLIPLESYLILGPYYRSSWLIFLAATGLNAGLAITGQWLLDQLTQRVTTRHPDLHQSRQRSLLLRAELMMFTPLFVTVAISCYAYFHWVAYSLRLELLPATLPITVVANSVLVGLVDSIYSMAKWQEKEELRKVTLQSQYASPLPFFVPI